MIFQDLLILLCVVWAVAVLLRRLGLPTIMGELIMGVVLGPAVLGWVQPSEIIDVLAQMGIFFLMLHTGVQTEPRQFFRAAKHSLGVAVVGSLVPFAAGVGVGLAFGLPTASAVFVGLSMTATAVVITLKTMRDLGLRTTRVAHVVVAACVVDDLIALLMFGIILAVVRGDSVSPAAVALIVVKVVAYFALVMSIGYWVYPLFKHPFRSRRGKGFTFVLMLGMAFGLLAEQIGLNLILGAYLAGLFFEEKVASHQLFQKVEDRLYGIAYSFLGPIFFVSLGFHIRLDVLYGSGALFVGALTGAVLTAQIASAGGMARLLGFSWVDSLGVGIGMCGRAEMAFILAAIGMRSGQLTNETFSAVVATTFVTNLFTPLALRGIAGRLRRGERLSDA